MLHTIQLHIKMVNTGLPAAVDFIDDLIITTGPTFMDSVLTSEFFQSRLSTLGVVAWLHAHTC